MFLNRWKLFSFFSPIDALSVNRKGVINMICCVFSSVFNDGLKREYLDVGGW